MDQVEHSNATVGILKNICVKESTTFANFADVHFCSFCSEQFAKKKFGYRKDSIRFTRLLLN
jgi:hypothetical protein